MKVKVLTFLLAGSLAGIVSANPDMNALIDKLADERWLPRQQALASEISDALLDRLKHEPLEAVVESLPFHGKESIHTLTWNGRDRLINLATLWHRNEFQLVHFNNQPFAGKTAHGAEFYPVIQWRRADGQWAARSLHRAEGAWPDEHIEGAKASFYDMHRLDSAEHELYLLIGVHPGDQLPALVSFLVIAFNGDELVLDYPAFEKRYPLLEATLYNNDEPAAYLDYFSYDPQTQRLSFERLGERDLISVPEDSRRLTNKILNSRPKEKLSLQFIDGHFRSVVDD